MVSVSKETLSLIEKRLLDATAAEGISTIAHLLQSTQEAIHAKK